MLVLVDGVRVASANTGSFAWEQLPLDAIQRIEIVRGPRAAQWGSDAIGGVIQIFTRKLDAAHFAVHVGSHGDYAESVGVGHWSARGGASVLVGARHVLGYPAINPQNFAYSPQPDGYSNQNLAARFAWRFDKQALSGSLLRSDALVEFNQGTSRVIEQAFGVRLNGALSDHLRQRVEVGTDREDLGTAAYRSLMLSRRNQASYQLAWSFERTQDILAALDWMHERGISRDTASNIDTYTQSRDNLGIYAGWYGHRGVWDWQLAARHDHNSVFGGATTGSAATGYQVNNWVRIEASFVQGFRSPSLEEQFSPGYFGYYAGNPDLRPERSHSSEIDLLVQPFREAQIKLAGYSTRVSNLITFAGSNYQAINIGRAAMDGLELTASWSDGPWTNHVMGDYDDARNALTGERLLRRPLRRGDINVDRKLGRGVRGGIDLFAAGNATDYGGATLGGYALLSAHVDWRLDRNLALRLFIENLLDRTYSLAYGYAAQVRSGWVTLSWSP